MFKKQLELVKIYLKHTIRWSDNNYRSGPSVSNKILQDLKYLIVYASIFGIKDNKQKNIYNSGDLQEIRLNLIFLKHCAFNFYFRSFIQRDF